MNSNELLEMLKPFCATKDDPFISQKQPFSFHGFTYAQNGHVVVRVPLEYAMIDDSLPAIESPDKWTHGQSFHEWVELPLFDRSILKSCRWCKGIGKLVVCEECDGSGEIEWDTPFHSYSATCQSCKGEGYTPGCSEDSENCFACGGTKVQPISIQFGFHKTNGISTRYLDLLSALPGIEISLYQTGVNQHYSFRFCGGEGIVMPMII